MNSGLAQSVQTRLVHHAQATGVDPNFVLARYAVERMLYRLSRSSHADRFVLKGALLLAVWLGETTRPTRDADLLGLGNMTADELATLFAGLCSLDVEPDGLEFDATSIRVAPIRPEDAYGGQRVTMFARLGRARLRIQVDVGAGDAVTPEPEWIEYPTLLDLPRPRLRAYRPETAIAEKMHAMVVLGTSNSRMKDFFDVHVLAMRQTFEGTPLVLAVRATFARRGTEIPRATPVALTSAFADVEGRGAQWAAFIRRSRITAVSGELPGVIVKLREFGEPLLVAAGAGAVYNHRWLPGGPWRPSGVRR